MHTTNEQHESNPTATARAKTICKLGLDAHAASITVARQLDGANPQRPQRFPVPKFLAWVEEQVKKGYQVISCYEAGPTRLLVASEAGETGGEQLRGVPH